MSPVKLTIPFDFLVPNRVMLGLFWLHLIDSRLARKKPLRRGVEEAFILAFAHQKMMGQQLVANASSVHLSRYVLER